MQQRRAIRKSKSKPSEPMMEKKCSLTKLPKKSYENARIQASIAKKYGLDTPQDRMRQKSLLLYALSYF